MLTCAMCGRVLKECCDIYEEAEDTQTGETVYLCGDCAAKVEAWAGLADYKPEDEQLREFCDRHECREQKEEMTGERCANCLYFEQAESEMRGRCMYKYPPAFVLPEEWCRWYVPINEEAGE